LCVLLLSSGVVLGVVVCAPRSPWVHGGLSLRLCFVWLLVVAGSVSSLAPWLLVSSRPVSVLALGCVPGWLAFVCAVRGLCRLLAVGWPLFRSLLASWWFLVWVLVSLVGCGSLVVVVSGFAVRGGGLCGFSLSGVVGVGFRSGGVAAGVVGSAVGVSGWPVGRRGLCLLLCLCVLMLVRSQCCPFSGSLVVSSLCSLPCSCRLGPGSSVRWSAARCFSGGLSRFPRSAAPGWSVRIGPGGTCSSGDG
jgi:hypothetical protein